MTRPNQLGPHTTMADRHRARGGTHDPAREARTRRSLDAVFASYIRELTAAGRELGSASGSGAGSRGD